jgi:hypothetical protein
VTISDTKTHKKRFFALVSDGNVNPVALFRKYFSLRPLHITHRRLIISYRKGKCTVQPCGIHFFSKILEKIARYLNLEDPTLYTGYCTRRSAATFLVNAGGDILDLQELGDGIQVKLLEGTWKKTSQKMSRLGKRSRWEGFRKAVCQIVVSRWISLHVHRKMWRALVAAGNHVYCIIPKPQQQNDGKPGNGYERNHIQFGGPSKN